MRIAGGIVYDEETDSTKTGVARTVKLNSRALAVLQRQKASSLLVGDFVFLDPETGKGWGYRKITDMRVFWEPALKRAGIRYRRPYNTRHTYATLGLMAGANAGFLAKQPGHSKRMFFEVYADWIDGEGDDREMAKIEAAINGFIPGLSPKADATAPENEKAPNFSMKSGA